MNWVTPFWLGSILALLGGAVLAFREAKKREAKLELFAKKKLWSQIFPLFDREREHQRRVLWFVSVFFLLLALARPQFGKVEEVVRTTGLDIVVALDVSNSMAVEDAIPNRLAKSKHWLGSFMDQLGGDRVALVAFAGSSFVASPLTTDHDYIREILGDLSHGSISNQGTDLDLALGTAARLLAGGAEALGEDQTRASSVVILVTDGEDNEGLALESARKLKESGVNLYILGVGTEQGGPIPIRDESGQMRGYKRDAQGGTVVSRFTGDSLDRLAEAGGGRMVRLTESEDEVREILGAIGKMDRRGLQDKKVVTYQERFQIPLALAVILLVVSSVMRVRKLAVLLLGFWLWGAAPVYASSESDPAVSSVIQNKFGIRALEEKNTKEAVRLFSDAQVESPDFPELQFNTGVAQVLNSFEIEKQKEGDPPSKQPQVKVDPAEIAAAAQSFQGAAQRARQQKRHSVEALSWFNRGVLQGAAKQFPEAIESYVRAIGAARAIPEGDEGGAEILQNARKNLELLLRQQKQMQEEQQKQKQDSQKQEPQDQKDDQEKKDQGEKKDGSDAEPSDSGKGQEKDSAEKKGGSDPKDQQKNSASSGNEESQEEAQARKAKAFESKNLTAEDAEQVMNDLSQREKELRSKLRRQRGAKGQTTEKDW